MSVAFQQRSGYCPQIWDNFIRLALDAEVFQHEAYIIRDREMAKIGELKSTTKLLTLSSLRHTMPPIYNQKTLTRTSTFQSDFQRAKPLVEYAEGVYRDQRGASKAKAQKPNGPPSCKGKSSLIVQWSDSRVAEVGNCTRYHGRVS
ncbi:MAG: hypothetical protein DCC56_05395 [Anaerolineae bacterium]|nr:MAG: hypothetical protein DCC56_05395 [Anaerolineae bacterium]